MGGCCACCACCMSDDVSNKFKNFWEIDNVIDIQNNPISMQQYKNNVILVVNVASMCGLTKSQYTQLVQLHEELAPQGFQILAFPCNQFMYQEPKGNQGCSDFAKTKYHAKFPMFSKVNVNGSQAADIFKWLRLNSELHTQGNVAKQVSWNFGKFLVNPDGSRARYYGPKFQPRDIKDEIQKLLNEKKQ